MFVSVIDGAYGEWFFGTNVCFCFFEYGAWSVTAHHEMQQPQRHAHMHHQTLFLSRLLARQQFGCRHAWTRVCPAENTTGLLSVHIIIIIEISNATSEEAGAYTRSAVAPLVLLVGVGVGMVFLTGLSLQEKEGDACKHSPTGWL